MTAGSDAMASGRDFAYWRDRAAALRPETRAFIDGGYVEAADGATFTRISPIDGRAIPGIARCGAEDVDRAVGAARAAFGDGRWSRLEPTKRKAVLLRFAGLIEDDVEELALRETLDVGKPIGDSLAVDVRSAARCVAYYAEYADKLYEEIAPTGPNDLAIIRRMPLGVVGAIVPWNYPLILASWKIAPALVLGNSVVLKPAEQSSLSAIRLAELAHKAGIPDGVFNVLPGYGHEAGVALVRHMDVDMIAFTGSTSVGRLIMKGAAESNMKRVALELGGKSPHIVMDDCPDLDAAASSVAWGVFYNSGQTCHAGTRLIVHRAVVDDLHHRVIEATKAIRLGHPLDPATQIGAVIEEDHMHKILGYIDLGREEGGRILLGGSRADVVDGGFYVEPTVISGVANASRVAQEEIFGPVLVSISVDGEEEAVCTANDTIYGLGAAVWTRDINRAHRMSEALRAGTVWVNAYDLSSMAAPFGGFKQSGFGRDRSAHALDKYADLKTVWTHYS
jgi:acyl-CoA reductase-like NAD-dependent aldehyde dehydrogenase